MGAVLSNCWVSSLSVYHRLKHSERWESSVRLCPLQGKRGTQKKTKLYTDTTDKTRVLLLSVSVKKPGFAHSQQQFWARVAPPSAAAHHHYFPVEPASHCPVEARAGTAAACKATGTTRVALKTLLAPSLYLLVNPVEEIRIAVFSLLHFAVKWALKLLEMWYQIKVSILYILFVCDATHL